MSVRLLKAQGRRFGPCHPRLTERLQINYWRRICQNEVEGFDSPDDAACASMPNGNTRSYHGGVAVWYKSQAQLDAGG
jgi:hypothetical protein